MTRREQIVLLFQRFGEDLADLLEESTPKPKKRQASPPPVDVSALDPIVVDRVRASFRGRLHERRKP